MEIFGKRLKELRQEKNLTQIQLGKIFSVRDTTISAWEKAKTEPSQKTLIDLAKYFNVTVHYLLGIED